MPSTSPVTVAAPASKSLSHRALIAAALGQGDCLVHGLLDSDDLRRTTACLTAGGARFEQKGPDVLVHGLGGGMRGGTTESPAVLEVHESGTTCRLLCAVAAAGKGSFLLTGAPRMHERPIGELVTTLTGLGVDIAYQGKSGCPPLLIETKGFTSEHADISLEESSQYLSGLLLAAPLGEAHLCVNVTGGKAVSWPYVALTLSVMDAFGIYFKVLVADEAGHFVAVDWRSLRAVIPGRTRFVVQPGTYQAAEFTVEGDWSNASYLLAAGAVGRRPVTVTGLKKDSLQGDRAIADILERMGAKLTWTAEGLRVDPSKLHGIEVNMADCPDIVPTVGVLAALADSPTRISGVAHLKIKECDRQSAVATELARFGARSTLTDDGLIIEPTAALPKGPVAVTSYNDHRLAMSMSLFSLTGVEVNVDNPACVGKSFPDFWERLDRVRNA